MSTLYQNSCVRVWSRRVIFSQITDYQDFEHRHARLKTLLEKTAMYSAFLKERMDKGKTALRTTTPSEPIPKPKAKAKPKPKGKQTRRQSKAGRKRLRVDDNDDSDEETDSKRAKLDEEVLAEGPPKFKQPDLITGATLKDYQLDGVEWMVSLDQNGASGILGTSHRLRKLLYVLTACVLCQRTRWDLAKYV